MKKSRTGFDERACWQLIADLYDEANDHEAQTLQYLLVRSGWAWKCSAPGDHREHCNAVNDYNNLKCQNCASPR